MAIIAAHMLLHTPEADAVRAVLRDVFGYRAKLGFPRSAIADYHARYFGSVAA